MTVSDSNNVVLGLRLSDTLIVLSGTMLSLYLLYLWLLPKPIPGIPYNKEATSKLFGDIESMVKYTSETQELYQWIIEQNIKLKSPIIQLFARPFRKPWVIVTDFQETRDVMLRRSKEFDRSPFWGEVSGSIIPDCHVHMPTNARFKRQRRWLQGLMTPAFLHDVAASHIYDICLDLIELWDQKSRLTQGRPFAAADDVTYIALDAIWRIVFGAESSVSTTKNQLELYSSIQTVHLPEDPNAEVILPRAPCPPQIQSIITLEESGETSLKSPFPKIAHWFIRQTSGYRNAYNIKEKAISDELSKALRRREVVKSEKDRKVNSAIDDLLYRESLLAEKEGRAPQPLSRGIHDEILGLLIAAHDTAATAIIWGFKFLADHPDVQNKLRSDVRAAHATATNQKRLPTCQEIVYTTVHYRDAVIEEIIRCSHTESALIRTALVDLQLLGHHIPKGTDVFFMGNGPSVSYPAFDIEDSLRSQTYHAAAAKENEKIGRWDPEDMGLFQPERWLVTTTQEEDGGKIFNSTAGPLLTFGLGERGCYGRKMAYVEMKLFITLIVWNFELQKCPDAMSSYAAVDKLVHAPQYCFVKLRKLPA
ncbi:uncharacterized protein TRIVIDRAFT_53637 [Trichoderma virens Gv29-8]|uniref:Cytochrome P450 monooxygenase n=1 Tax=Hypocrea virens (strain Gv29-8 / FGSC 10586) TaxID=413071 RepID=G9MU21_HYPVG|nr:uncharacterized protein TRIVIDRAFT_53637 [Trichoderma virens Gv29-8]EHK22059.1 hypothetical protein TRIVIDRAFT_53637 [Trichoderma virens Gv29-8]UKZ54389.1 hypothetical protein TrVGV298_008197 [Trichoderma virens]